MTCLVSDCLKPAKRRGWCIKHYTRFLRHGDPEGGAGDRGFVRKWILDHVDHECDKCLFWPFYRDKAGYGRINYEGRDQIASRVMCTLAHGDKPEGKDEAAHSCGNGHLGCVNPKHLSWATYSENNLDKRDHGTMMRGEKHCFARLTEDAIPQIRKRLRRGESFARIAADYGVHRGTIANIKYGKAWSWV